MWCTEGTGLFVHVQISLSRSDITQRHLSSWLTCWWVGVHVQIAGCPTGAASLAEKGLACGEDECMVACSPKMCLKMGKG